MSKLLSKLCKTLHKPLLRKIADVGEFNATERELLLEYYTGEKSLTGLTHSNHNNYKKFSSILETKVVSVITENKDVIPYEQMFALFMNICK